jgi:hypothetical protein
MDLKGETLTSFTASDEIAMKDILAEILGVDREQVTVALKPSADGKGLTLTTAVAASVDGDASAVTAKSISDMVRDPKFATDVASQAVEQNLVESASSVLVDTGSTGLAAAVVDDPTEDDSPTPVAAIVGGVLGVMAVMAAVVVMKKRSQTSTDRARTKTEVEVENQFSVSVSQSTAADNEDGQSGVV